jgi:hypothetical protein
MLEPYAMKVARTVLRGGSDSNATPLPDPKEHRDNAVDGWALRVRVFWSWF